MPRMKTGILITLATMLAPAYFIGLAQLGDLAPSIISALAQAPLVIAFGWFVLKLAQMQQETHRETMRLFEDLCKDFNPDNKD